MSSTQSDRRGVLLSHPMRDMLWRIAQHKHGWTYVTPYRGQRQVAEALARRGLVVLMDGGEASDTAAVATPAGLLEIHRRWPVSPYALGTYEYQPGGWTPKEGVSACP